MCTVKPTKNISVSICNYNCSFTIFGFTFITFQVILVIFWRKFVIIIIMMTKMLQIYFELPETIWIITRQGVG